MTTSSGRLVRALGPWSAGAFVVTNMVGSGIFTVPAFVRSATGSGLAALGVWAAGAILALCGAFAYAELATRMPEAGGEYRYLARIYGPLWGFLSGWVSFFVGFSAALAAAALGVVAYAANLVPGWDPAASVASGWPVTQGALAASSLVVGFAVVHSLGVRPGGRLQSFLAGLVLLGIGLLVAVGFGSGHGELGRVAVSVGDRGSWWVALIQVTFAYSGWNAAAYLAGEVKDPRHTLPRALVAGTVLVTIAYLGLNLLFFYAVPPEAWEPAIDVGHRAAEALFGSVGARGVSGLIAVAILGSVSAMTAAGPRVYYAMAEDGLAPGVLGRLSRRGSAPVVAIVSQAAFAAALALTGAFEALLVYVGSALLLFAGLAVAAVFVVRRRDDGASKRVFRVPGYPLTPAIFLLMVIGALGYGFVEEPVPTGAALATVLAGAALYGLGHSRGWVRPEV